MTEKKKKENGLLDAVQEAMGGMGPWQIIIAVALSFANFPAAWNQLSSIILTAPPKFKCIDPVSVDNDTVYTAKSCFVNVTAPLGNNSLTQFKKCQKFEYDRSVFDNTIITEWDLVCDDQYLAILVQSGTMCSVLVGNMLFSLMADRIGRKIPLMIAVVVQSVTMLLSTLSPWFWLFLLCKFIAAVATGGAMLITFVLLMEIVGIEWRSTLSVLFHITFPVAHLLIPMIAYYTKAWRGFVIATSIPSMALVSYYWLVPESPRWLLAVGKVKRAKKVLESAAKRNSIPQEKVIAAIESHSNQSGKDIETDLESSKTYNHIDLFRTPRMRIRTICIAVNWFVCGICYYGLAQYVGQLEGSIFLNIAVSAACELPGIVIVVVLISRVSRLKILIGSNATSGVSLLLMMFIHDPTARVALATIGQTAMAMSFPTLYLYTGELFPTVVRNIGIGFCSVSSKVGSMIAPYIATLGIYGVTELSPLLFGIGPLIGAGLCFFLPETMDCKLPETIKEAESFRQGKREITTEAGD